MSAKIIHVPRRMVREEWGGTETVIVEISKKQKERGFDPEIYTSLALSNRRSEDVCGIATHRFGYTYTRLGLSRENRKLLDKRGGDLYSLAMFVKLLVCNNAMVLHLHTAGRIGALVRLVARLKGIPYVVSIHGGAIDIPKELVDQIVKPLKGSFNWGKPFDILLRKNRVLDDASGIICLGAGEQNRMQEKYPNKKIAYFPNGVDINKFRSGSREHFFRKHGIPADSRVILSVASFYSQKNQLLLVNSFAKLRREGEKITLVMVGVVYDDKYFREILEAIAEHKIADSVVLIQNLDFDDPELSDCYAAADVFVHTSRYETFGIVILEAWAAGKPVICAPVGGIKSFVEDRENGLFFDLEKPDDLTDKMRTLLADEALQKKLVNNGSQAVEKYSWDVITDQLLDFYRDVAQ